MIRVGGESILGTILQEILQAFKNKTVLKRVTEHLDAVPLLTLDRDGYKAAAAIHRKCASKGITASTVDCQIAEAAIRNNCLLLTADKDFESIAKHTDLRLA
jgi:predicted nucleic acid-binding protein